MSSLDPLSFLMKISPKLLQVYLQRHEIKFREKIEEETSEKYADALIQTLIKESQDKQASFNTDIENIDSISSTKGCEYLLSRAREEDLNFDENTYDKLSNMKERALYFYLNYNDLFHETRDQYDLENKLGWRGRKTESFPVESVEGNIGELQIALKSLYNKECKGNNIKIKSFTRSDSVTYIAYVEDILTNELAFEGDELDNGKPHKPVFPTYFRYRPDEGVLEVKAVGGNKQIKLLQDIFILHFLKADPREHEKHVRYNFGKIKNLDTLEFPTSLEDKVENVTLKGLRIVHNEKTVSLSIDITTDPNRSGVLPMQERLKDMDIDLDDYEVTKFKLQILFKSEPGQMRQERLTVAITHPNICDLKDREIDSTVRKLLKTWRIDLY